MALTDKKYEKFYATTGSGDDEASSDNLTKAEGIWDHYRAKGMDLFFDDFKLAPLIYQLQQMQDELDYLRTEISNNKDKTGISNSQASAITANTAKTGITTQQASDISNNKTNISTNTTNIAGKLKVGAMPTVPSGVEQEVECGVVFDSKAKTYSMSFAYSETSTVKGNKQTVTRTGSIQLK